jgi:hypothetical protein
MNVPTARYTESAVGDEEPSALGFVAAWVAKIEWMAYDRPVSTPAWR